MHSMGTVDLLVALFSLVFDKISEVLHSGDRTHRTTIPQNFIVTVLYFLDAIDHRKGLVNLHSVQQHDQPQSA